MTIQSTQGIINESEQKEGTGYVLLNRLHAVGFKKRPGQGEAPTPESLKPQTTPRKRSPGQAQMSKSEKRNRTELLLGIRCLPEEKEAIQEKARLAGLSVGEFLRRCALDRKIAVRTDVKLMKELLRLGGLQKHLYNEMQTQMTPELSRQFSDVLVELRKAVVALDIGINPSERAEK